MKETATKMNKRPKLLGIYLFVTLLALSAGVALRSYALLTELNAYGYFDDKLIINIANGVVTAAVILLLSYLVFEKKDLRLIPSFESPLSYAPSGIVTAALVFLSIDLFKRSSDALLQTLNTVLLTLGGILALLSAVYFVAGAVFMIRRRSMLRSDFGLIVLVFFCIYIATVYFDTALPINAPNKIVDEMAYLSAALFFLYETRLSLNREKWRSYIAFGLIAMLLCAYSSVPSLILYFIEGKTVSYTVFENLLTIALFIFAFSKIVLTTILVEDVESPIITGVITSHEARKKELEQFRAEIQKRAEENARSEESDDSQLTISDIPVQKEQKILYTPPSVGLEDLPDGPKTLLIDASQYPDGVDAEK